MPALPEHLIVQAILAAQATGGNPKKAAEEAARAYQAGLTAFKEAVGQEDPNAAFLREAATRSPADDPHLEARSPGSEAAQ